MFCVHILTYICIYLHIESIFSHTFAYFLDICASVPPPRSLRRPVSPARASESKSATEH